MEGSAYFDAPQLLDPPVKRAAYSDRTAWLMAEMSRLAYEKFEGGTSLKSLAKELTKATREADIIDLLNRHLANAGVSEEKAREELAGYLARANFSLVGLYNAHGTQGFLAKFDPKDKGAPFLALVFRGTEADAADIKADLSADLILDPNGHRVHRGFYQAFNAVKAEIEEHIAAYSGLPVYVTGHSLGGALAIMATKYLVSDSLGACYTFGGPRVGESVFADSIKTPIYRVVNAIDAVPRLPPARIDVVVFILKRVPFPGRDWIVKFLDRFRGYAHYGDMRYLTAAPPASDAQGVPYGGLRLLNNPALLDRLVWFIRRVVSTRGKALGGDHAIALYCAKLKAHALRRN